jgi:hypothetical protein
MERFDQALTSLLASGAIVVVRECAKAGFSVDKLDRDRKNPDFWIVSLDGPRFNALNAYWA